MRASLLLGLGALLLTASSCAAGGKDHSTGSSGNGGSGGSAGNAGSAGAGAATSSANGGGTGAGATTGVGGDLGGAPAGGAGGAPAEGEVYGHSDKMLFKLEPISKTITTIGTFDCITISLPGSGEGMWDIALNKDGQMYGTSAMLEGFSLSGALVKVDKGNAHCSVVAKGTFPNSLTFVPAGTLDAVDEALVGYNATQYVRIDTTTGAQTPIGDLNPPNASTKWESSGDIVSIINDKTYLTVKPFGSGSGYAGPDTIVEVDPTTGQVVKVIGDTTYPKLWGLGYWGGIAYGFSATGQLCAIDLTNGSATGIPLMNIPSGLAFWGAGVTTAAPTEVPK